jgi:predicted enzyme involved in methoxymalonyl-ACP biosynthesis
MEKTMNTFEELIIEMPFAPSKTITVTYEDASEEDLARAALYGDQQADFELRKRLEKQISLGKALEATLGKKKRDGRNSNRGAQQRKQRTNCRALGNC